MSRRRAAAPRVLAIVAVVVLVAAALVLVRAISQGGEDAAIPRGSRTVPDPARAGGEGAPAAGEDAPGAEAAPPFVDPYSYVPERQSEFEQRAARGFAHVLHRNAPGGVLATAQRVGRFRTAIEQVAARAQVDPDLLEALVFLESAGHPDVVAGGRDLSGAVGLTQILAETGTNLLDLRVDVGAARRLTRRIARAEQRGDLRRADRLRARRRRVDERFDPEKALAATGRYLVFARSRLGGREDLAFVSYHMGVGNLEDVIADFGADRRDPPPYAQIYFDSTPRVHPEAHRRLAGFGDESAGYYWKLLAAREILRAARSDPDRLLEADELHAAKNSAEEVLHPPASTLRFDRPDTLAAAWDAGEIVAIPNDPGRLGIRRDRRMGELAPRLDQPPDLYRGLRPEALAMAIYIAAEVNATAGGGALTITSGVRDDAYQRVLVRRNEQATRNFSLHTTGYAFDVSRRYPMRGQGQAFQAVLDRLQALDLIAWVREPGAIHITVSADARAYLPLLDRIEPRE